MRSVVFYIVTCYVSELLADTFDSACDRFIHTIVWDKRLLATLINLILFANRSLVCSYTLSLTGCYHLCCRYPYFIVWMYLPVCARLTHSTRQPDRGFWVVTMGLPAITTRHHSASTTSTSVEMLALVHSLMLACQDSIAFLIFVQPQLFPGGLHLRGCHEALHVQTRLGNINWIGRGWRSCKRVARSGIVQLQTCS